ncbi:MAG: hypothetical protein AAGU27_25505 [Dehalobacterium sp.]
MLRRFRKAFNPWVNYFNSPENYVELLGAFASKNTFVAWGCALKVAQKLKNLFLQQVGYLWQVPAEFPGNVKRDGLD